MPMENLFLFNKGLRFGYGEPHIRARLKGIKQLTLDKTRRSHVSGYLSGYISYAKMVGRLICVSCGCVDVESWLSASDAKGG